MHNIKDTNIMQIWHLYLDKEIHIKIGKVKIPTPHTQFSKN